MNEEKFPEEAEAKNYSYSEDEIDLADYLRILWKWKRLIIFGTLICGFVAGIVSFLMPKIYEVSSVIEPGIIGFNKEGSFIYIDSPVNMKEKIEKGAYNRKIQEALHLDPKVEIKFKATIGREAKVIKITSQWEEKDINIGIKATQKLLEFLGDDYGGIVENKRNDYDKQIKLQMSRIKVLEERIKLLEAICENIKHRKEELVKEIEGVRENTKEIIQQRNEILKKENLNKELSLLLYSSTIQQNIAYFNQLNDQLYDLSSREKEIENKIEKLRKDIDNINIQINLLDREKELISGIRVIQEPQASLHPIKPKKVLNISISLILGLFSMIFLAFFLEYFRGNKNKIFTK